MYYFIGESGRTLLGQGEKIWKDWNAGFCGPEQNIRC